MFLTSFLSGNEPLEANLALEPLPTTKRAEASPRWRQTWRFHRSVGNEMQHDRQLCREQCYLRSNVGDTRFFTFTIASAREVARPPLDMAGLGYSSWNEAFKRVVQVSNVLQAVFNRLSKNYVTYTVTRSLVHARKIGVCVPWIFLPIYRRIVVSCEPRDGRKYWNRVRSIN